MKPYGRIKHVTGGNKWKLDYHLHDNRCKEAHVLQPWVSDKNGKKLENWWEEICGYLPRTTIKKLWKKDIDVEQYKELL